MPKSLDTIDDLQPDLANLNTGTPRGRALLEKSLSELGAGRSICVDKNGVTIAGNKTLIEAATLGFPIRVVQTDGTELVVVQRTDLDLLTDRAAKRLAIADNRATVVGFLLDVEQLAVQLQDDPTLTDGFFTDDELAEIAAEHEAAHGQEESASHQGYSVLVTLANETERTAFVRRMKIEGTRCREL